MGAVANQDAVCFLYTSDFGGRPAAVAGSHRPGRPRCGPGWPPVAFCDESWYQRAVSQGPGRNGGRTTRRRGGRGRMLRARQETGQSFVQIARSVTIPIEHVASVRTRLVRRLSHLESSSSLHATSSQALHSSHDAGAAHCARRRRAARMGSYFVLLACRSADTLRWLAEVLRQCPFLAAASGQEHETWYTQDIQQ